VDGTTRRQALAGRIKLHGGVSQSRDSGLLETISGAGTEVRDRPIGVCNDAGVASAVKSALFEVARKGGLNMVCCEYRCSDGLVR
jgi:hypothetical protein